MKVRALAAVAALALGTAIGGGAAQAATYYLTVDGCSSNCLGSNTEIGTVTVTQGLSGVLNFAVSLDNGAVFNSNGNSEHNAFVFDLNSGGASLTGLKYSNFTTVNSSNQTVSTTDFAGASGSSFSESPFGKNAWSNAVDYVGNAKQGGAESNFSFQLSDSLNNLSLSMLTFGSSYNGKNIEFAADVYANKTTGNVGAVYQSSTGAVPEPGTWGLMIMGVFGVGAVMRHQRRRAAAAA